MCYNGRRMKRTNNLKEKMTQGLPAELISFMALAGKVAVAQEQKLFLVGGVVRDLLIGRPNNDLDLVAECDAIQLAETLAKTKNGRVVAHSRFNTATLKWAKWSVDFATARAESYAEPGALPTVQCRCDIKDDLRRRDFTINAMAISLAPDSFGELIDLYGGVEDLRKGVIRVLHGASFKDDATRIWRAVRYEQRLGFRIERQTLTQLKRDIDYLDAISGDRVRHELELCLEEEKPELVLGRADRLGVLAKICPALEADEWVCRNIARARGMLQPYCPPAELYLALLIYRLPEKDLDDLALYLKLPKQVATTLRDTLKLKNDLSCFSGEKAPPSVIYQCLHRFAQNAILANLIAADSGLVRQRMEMYLNELRQVRTAVTGQDLIDLNVASGKRLKTVLEGLLLARLDREVANREEEIALAKKIAEKVERATGRV